MALMGSIKYKSNSIDTLIVLCGEYLSLISDIENVIAGICGWIR